MTDSLCTGVESFGVCIPEKSCRFVMQIPPEHRCEFAQETQDCRDENTLLHYTMFIICNFSDFDLKLYLAYLYLLMYLMFYFVMLSAVTHFFFPSLCYLVTNLGIARNIAGATIIAWGYTAPSFMMILVGVLQVGPEMILCHVIGSSMYELTCLTALVSIIKPFEVRPSVFLGVFITYSIAIIILIILNLHGDVHMYEPLVYLGFYALHVIVCLADDVRSKIKDDPTINIRLDLLVQEEAKEKNIKIIKAQSGRQFSWREVEAEEQRELLRRYTGMSHYRKPTSLDKYLRQILFDKCVDLPPSLLPRSQTVLWVSSSSAMLSVVRIQTLAVKGYSKQAWRERMGNRDSIAVEVEGRSVIVKDQRMFQDFLNYFLPVVQSDWDFYNNLEKVFALATAPIVYFCKLFIPCVDSGVLTDNWCKMAACLHCFTSTAILSGMVNIYAELDMVFCLGLLGAFALATFCVVFAMTTTHKAPSFHIIYVFIGYVITNFLLYFIANEVFRVLEVCAYLFSISSPMLWITVLVWGNSLGNVVHSIYISKAGYPRVAWDAICRNNLFIMLVGVGTAFLILVMIKGDHQMIASEMEHSAFIFTGLFYLFTVHLFTLFVIPTLNFMYRRSFAIFLLVTYFMFLLHCSLLELKVIAAT